MRVDFERLQWENYPSTNTPLNADNLNRLEEGVAGLYSDVSEIQEELGEGVGEYVTDWLDEHVTPGGSTIVVDDTLTIQGAAADAKKTGDEISSVKDGLQDIKEEISHLDGLSEDVKQALLQIASKVAYIDADGQDYYDDLYNALYPPTNLVSISAVYTQSGTVYDTDTLNSLKTDLVVTAHYDDSSSETVTAYTLSGSLAVGTSTITVSYGGKTTTFSVTVTENRQIPASYTWLYDARQGELLSEQSYVTKETGGSGGTETIVDNQLVLNSQPPASSTSNNFLRFLLSDTSTTNAKLSGRVKFVKAVTHLASYGASGFRLQLSNGTNGAQAFFLDNSRKIDVAYFTGSTRSIYSTDFLFDEYHLIELELSNGTQKLSIDGTEVFSSSTLSSNYCTANAILNQAPPVAQDPDGIITVIDWLSYYEVS